MRLIDADALKKHYAWWEDDRQELFDSIVDQQPTVDAVPVIRCKDCARGATCFTYRETGDGDGFCKWAERRPQTP